MRPLRLVMRAFGPYPAEEVVDFRPLGDGALFLICGSTGSGKSTIIDAMAFALYGEACSEDRDGKGSRSHLAAAERVTEVVFDFALGPERYRVVRRPDQERPKKKREGVTLERQSAELWRRTRLAPSDDLLEGEPLAARWEAVNDKIAALLGFDCQQFRQVIVLPQGRFRDLLTADVLAREAIFQKLFRTSIYSSLQDRLKERARGIETENETLKTRWHEVLRQAGVESPESLGTRRAETNAEIERFAQAGEALAATVVQTRAILDEARAVAVRFAERTEADHHFRAQQTRVKSLAERRAEARLARLAEPVDPFAKAVTRRETEWQALTRRHETVTGEQREAHRLAAEAQTRLSQEDGRQQERDDVAGRLNFWQALLPKVSVLARLSSQRLEAEKVLAKRQQQSAAARHAQREIEQAEADAARQRADREPRAAAVEALAAQLAAAVRDADRHAQLGQRRAELATLENHLQARAIACAKAEAEAARLVAELNSLEAAQRDGRAALLAMQLEEEVACPVCGSCHHPSPATSQTVPPSDEIIAAAKRTAADAGNHARRARESLAAESNRPVTVRSQIDGLSEILGEKASLSSQGIQGELDTLHVALANAREAGNQLQKIVSRQEDLRRRADAARETWPAIEKAERAAELELQRIAAEVAAHDSEIPAHTRTPAALEATIAQERATLKSLQQAHEAARQRAAESLQRAVAADARGAELQAGVAEALAALEEARTELRSKLSGAGFTDEASLRAASRAPEKLRALEEELRATDDAFAAASERQERAVAAVAGLSLPDVAAWERQFQVADQALRRHIDAAATLRQQGAALVAAADSLTSIEAGLARVRSQYEVFGTLSEAANGRNGHNLTLQRYVLGALLDDVLVAATRRLLVMSRGRFRLLRQAARTDGRVAAGLALEVLDEWTGKLRPAGTLSGGESFLAALSLALGLADVVQAHAGGVRMEAMFIDEGFGSLDPEALDYAFQALLDLQRGGRLVGIISHVEELRQRIDVRLEIRASRRGSTTRFVGLPDMALT